MISPGSICTIPRFSGSQLWLAVGRAEDGVRWQLRSLRIDHNGRTEQTRRISGEGDIIVIREAPTFEPGTALTHNGVEHFVLSDLGHAVELAVPTSRYHTEGGDALKIEAGHTTLVPKFELVLAGLLASDGGKQ